MSEPVECADSYGCYLAKHGLPPCRPTRFGGEVCGLRSAAHNARLLANIGRAAVQGNGAAIAVLAEIEYIANRENQETRGRLREAAEWAADAAQRQGVHLQQLAKFKSDLA